MKIHDKRTADMPRSSTTPTGNYSCSPTRTRPPARARARALTAAGWMRSCGAFVRHAPFWTACVRLRVASILLAICENNAQLSERARAKQDAGQSGRCEGDAARLPAGPSFWNQRSASPPRWPSLKLVFKLIFPLETFLFCFFFHHFWALYRLCSSFIILLFVACFKVLEKRREKKRAGDFTGGVWNPF